MVIAGFCPLFNINKGVYLREVPERPGAVSQIIVGVPSIVHRLDPLLNKVTHN